LDLRHLGGVKPNFRSLLNMSWSGALPALPRL
jgi:hypothetical protein